MSCFLCAVGTRRAHWHAHPVNTGKSLAFIPFPEWLNLKVRSLSLPDHGGFIILFLVFPFVFKIGFYLALKHNQKK